MKNLNTLGRMDRSNPIISFLVISAAILGGGLGLFIYQLLIIN